MEETKKDVILGTSNRVLEVDLTSRKYSVYNVKEDERRLYLGAKGLGLKLLFDRMQPGADPLGSDNMLAVMPGVLLGTGGPCSGRFHAVSKSPLTGLFSSSSCGGPFGMQLKTAGWDGLILKGKSETPVWLEIDSDGITFHDASELWGLDTEETQKKLSAKKAGVMAIGPAGENLVKYANIASGHRFLGRGGLGAVMGSKNVKAVVANGGKFQIQPVNSKKFEKAKKRGTKYINQNEMSSFFLRKYGTNANVNLNNSAGILPVNNFSNGRDDRAYKLSGEVISEAHNTQYHTCKPCTILCGHKGDFGGKKRAVPEFETTALMGSNIGIFDPEIIAEWNDICGKMGMDTISAGGTMAWAMEAAEKGIFDAGLRFGEKAGIAEMLHDIGYARDKGQELGLGSRALSEKYGGKDFAIHVKGLEMAAYDPRGSFGQGLAYAVANRGACHLSAYLVALEVFFGLLSPKSIRAKAEFVKFFESLTNGINSLQTCQFTMYSYTLEPPLSRFTPDTTLGILMQNIPQLAIALMDFSLYPQLWSSVTGIKMSSAEFLKAGDRIQVLERYMNTREGVTRKDDTLPPRMLKEGRPCDPDKLVVPLEKLLDRYYRLRGYDSNGIPKDETLRNFGII
ncbi:aldehyde ferredoxin oxidoreductase family protein [Desulforegula conservatrix]|uniref:aldehyde ferredoxin oxidoreductase family protein n=1 Tax=Desulforegula conservatrix TaxID=153026 RepID=UPI00041CB7FD|nr:aldehyde ferredoxin oxidoreductase family protein [Desulforegula conservatrix]